jgi:hypothetical protein
MMNSKMKLSKYAIIARDVKLAEAVCSRLRKPGIYLPVFEAPQKCMMEYGFFENDCIQLGNAIRALEAKKILFLGVETDIAENLEEHFGRLESLALDAPDEKILARDFGANKHAVGLDTLQASDSDYGGELFAVEDNIGIATVIAANLAIAHNGKFLRLPEIAESELDILREYLRVWSNGTSEESKAALHCSLSFIKQLLPEPLKKTKSEQPISFITRGVPYGLLPLGRPTTHYFPFSSLGINVCSGMLKSLHQTRCPAVIIIDPNKVGLSEFELLRETFGRRNFFSVKSFVVKLRAGLGIPC